MTPSIKLEIQLYVQVFWNNMTVLYDKHKHFIWNFILCLQIFIPANPLLAAATWSTESKSWIREPGPSNSLKKSVFNEPVNRLHKSHCTVLSCLNDPDEPSNTIRNTEHNHTSLVLYCSGADIIIIAWRHDHYELSRYGKNCVKMLLFLFNRKKNNTKQVWSNLKMRKS